MNTLNLGQPLTKGYYVTQFSDGHTTWCRSSHRYPAFAVVPEWVVCVWHVKPKR